MTKDKEEPREGDVVSMEEWLETEKERLSAENRQLKEQLRQLEAEEQRLEAELESRKHDDPPGKNRRR